MPVGKPLHLRLFLEGEEVPVISAQVQINTSAPSTASVQIIPLETGLDLLPRTMVHLFFLDTKIDTSIGPRTQENEGSNLRGTYRLLFSGEVVGFSYSQTPASRGLVLQCIDFSNYWDSANVMAVSYGPGGNAFTNQGAVNGAQLGMFTDIPGDSAAEHLVRWLRDKPVTKGLTNVSGLAGGVIHIMEAMGGVPGHFKGVNDFYTIAELRCRLLNQITAEENDNTAAKVLAKGVFEEWLKNGIEQAGGNVTFRDIMKLLFQYIYYEFVPNPAPKFDEGKPPPSSTYHKVPLNQLGAVKGAYAELYSIWNVTLIPDNTSPPSSEIDALMNASVVRLKAVIKSLEAVGGTTAKAVKILKDVQEKFGKIRLIDTVPTINSEGILTSLSKLDINRNKILDARILLLGDDPVSVTNPPGGSSSQRLRTQIVRPDCWFSSPPACNVIFPEMYAQVTYDRNYLQETTRLLVASFDTLVGKDHLLANHILAPFAGYNDAAKLGKYKGQKSFRILMDHEIHVGIISKSQWIPNTAGVGQALDAKQLKKISNGRLDWLVKAALFHFFKYRFAARQLSVAGRFNPFLVCGFPGAVITRPYIIPGGAEALRKGHSGQPVPDSEVNDVIHSGADIFNAPSHFIGMIGAVQHSIDQSGGTTSATMHSVRKHRGIDDEFINLLRKTDEGSTKRIIKVILEVDAAQTLALQPTPNVKPLEILFGVTPQTEETATAPKPAAKNSKLVVGPKETKASKLKPTAADIGAAIKAGLSPLKLTTPAPTVDEQFESTFGSTQIAEQDQSSSQSTVKKDPPRTTRGPITAVGRTEVLIPQGSTKIKVNSEKKGLYGGKIVGIEVLDASLEPVSFSVSSRVAVYGNTTVGASGANQETLAIPTVAKVGSKPVTTKSRGVAFSAVAIYEEVSVIASGSLPLEEILRPSWFSTAYANQNIGEKIYNPFFGCGAVVDGLKTSGLDPVSSDASPDAEPVDAKTTAGDLKMRLEAEEASKRDVSIEKALNVLGYEYGQIKSQGMDVDSFIRDYTDRPIATFRDIFGDIAEPGGLSFTIVDSAVGGDVKVKEVTVNGVKKTPRVGFHTNATHPDLVGTDVKSGKLVGLTTDLQLGYTRVSGVGKSEPLVQAYDVRPAKKAKVMAYKAALEKGPGFQG